MNRLHIKSLLSIGAVEDGDNPEADIMFWKKRSTQEPEQGLIEKEAADVKHDLSALDPDARAYVEGLEAQVAGIDESPPPLPDDLPDVVTKRLDEQSELLAKANEENERVAKELADMREQRQVEKYTKMAADYAAVLGDPAETAPLLKAIGDKAEPELEAFMGRLSPLTNLAEVQKMLVEYGDASVDGSAVDQIAAYAVEIRKASPDLSVAEAKAQAWRDHPELKDAARQEGAV